MPVRHSFRSRQTGAGLIEVLIAVLVVTLGLLGAAGMHVRSVEFTMDTERRQMASMVATCSPAATSWPCSTTSVTTPANGAATWPATEASARSRVATVDSIAWSRTAT